MQLQSLKILLNNKVQQYNTLDFISNDPIAIPHCFNKKQDIEIAAFFAAILAWGNRKSIISSCSKLMSLMDNSPYNFIMNLSDDDEQWVCNFEHFVHRTFGFFDVVRVINFLRFHYNYRGEESLETAFSNWLKPTDENVENALNGFYYYFFDEQLFDEGTNCRTTKHIAAPFKKSACKRLNMFLRWMVRKDKSGVDFGLWQNIKPHQLIIPLDVHVLSVVEKLGIINNPKANWNTAVFLTKFLKQFDSNDPVKYDFALFSLGVNTK